MRATCWVSRQRDGEVDITGIDLRVKNGKLAEMWQNRDQLGMLQQIGAIPEAQAAPAG